MKKKLLWVLLAAGFMLMGTGCESLGTFATGYAYGYASTSEAGLDYSFYNYSSYPVTAQDSTGSVTIQPGSSARAHFNRSAPISNVSYSPSDKVSAEISGTAVYFRNR